jgi:aminopeptidase-like protein
MFELINDLWFLQRDLVSDDFDRALNRLAKEWNEHAALFGGQPMHIHTYPSGTRCWTWRIPEKWICEQAYLETMDGQRILDFANNPLHVISYSLPYDGIVEREELLRHLHVHPRLPDAIPFVFKYYERDWGLCLPQTLRDSLHDPAYRVLIRTRFEPGLLKVGEIIIPGETQQSFVIVSHLCHPAMVNDDLTGVVVTLETARRMLAGPRPHYTYRFLILPETIGSVAYLSHNEALIPTMVGGLFLEMLGNDSPHSLQGSMQPNSQSDRVLRTALPDFDPQARLGAYRTVINNDERQFNAPGVRVPMLSLSRVEPQGSPTRPYREYHSSFDTPAIITAQRLEESLNVTLGLLGALEDNQYPVNDFKGEIFCSGYGIWVDYRVNPEGHRRLFEIMERCDGEHTLADIADELSISFQTVRSVVQQLADHQLIHFSRHPIITDPHRLPSS